MPYLTQTLQTLDVPSRRSAGKILLGFGCLLFLVSLTASSSAQQSAETPPPKPVAVLPAPADRGDAHRLEWRWRRFGITDYALTAAFTAGYLYVEFGVGPPARAHWRGGILFDDAVRRSVVARSRRGRDRWAAASDVLALIPQGMMIVDSLLVPLLGDDWNTDVALQLSSIAAQSEALTALLSRAGHYGVGRERPDTAPCRSDPEYSASCYRGSTASFPGGHVAGAMVGAGIVCAHHLHVPLYAVAFWDVAACLSNVGIALGTGYARMAADRHYASDIITGSLLGAGAGLLLPSLLYYRSAADRGRPGSGLWTLAPLRSGDASGVALQGAF